MRQSALSRLLEGVRRPAHDKRPSIETFADIDVNRLAAELDLDALGADRGGRNEPATGSTAMDDVESRIVERIEAEKKSSHARVEDELRTYAERLSSLDFEGRFSGIRQAAPACIGEFRGEVAKGLNTLHGLRRDLREAEAEHAAFRAKHRLQRTAYVQSTSWLFMKWSLLAFLFLFEAVVNGSFLAKGNEQGLLGGVTEAIGFAFLNIGVAYLFATRGAIQIVHRSLVRKALGLTSLLVYFAIAVALNLSLAHYREVSASLVDGAGEIVMQRLQAQPFQLEDFNSWIFFCIGLLFSIIAFIDGLSMSDPYPGFAAVQKRLSERRDAYSDGVADLIDTLGDIKDSYREEMDEIGRDLSVRRTEHDVILRNRSRLIQLFDRHQDHLERSVNSLLAIYRQSNIRSRTTKSPKRFNSPYSLERVSVTANSSAEWKPEDLRDQIIQTQNLLMEEIQTIHTEFDKAVAQYRNLDDLIPDDELNYGTKPT